MTELSGKKYHIITFGCQMNEHDSETIAGLLQAEGCTEAEERMDADIVIINTCSVRENADKRFFGTLGQLKKQKAANPAFAACVCGCMMQQEHTVTQVRRQYPWVDVIFGTHNIHEFPQMLDQLYRARSAFAEEEDGANEDLIRMSDHDYTRAKHEIRSAKETRVERIYDVGVAGLHRLLARLPQIQSATCLVAAAGMEGALASVLGGLVDKPVIAVPTSVGYGASFGGVSALLTMINSCANGIAVVNIDNGYGAGYIATQINRMAGEKTEGGNYSNC